MAQSLFKKLFARSRSIGIAANDAHWDLDASGDPLDHPASDPEHIYLCIEDFDLHQRDLGQDCATALQKLVFERLQAELSKNETLVVLPAGAFELIIRDARQVDTDKLADHLADAVMGEAFTLNRCLIECELRID